MTNYIAFLSLLLATTINFISSAQTKLPIQTKSQEDRVFGEGDRILTIGAIGTTTKFERSLIKPSITFDYGLKKTNGILSIGFYANYASYFNQKIILSAGLINESFYQEDIAGGLRLGFHYVCVHKKLDLYGGLGIGVNNSHASEYSLKKIDDRGNISDLVTIPEDNLTTLQFTPLFGFRSYLSRKMSLNLEAAESYFSMGLGVKF